MATLAGGVLSTAAAQSAMGLSGGVGGVLAALAIAGASPAFTSFLLFKVSGIPMSEKKYDQRFKDDEKYQQWKRDTPMFFPKL